MRILWMLLLATTFGGNFLKTSAKQTSVSNATELIERSANFLKIFEKKDEATQSMVTSFTTTTTTSSYYVPYCTVFYVYTIATKYCANINPIVGRRKRRETKFIEPRDFQEEGGPNSELHSGLLEDSRFLKAKNPKFLKVFVKETWTSVQTVALSKVVYTTIFTPTTVTSITVLTTVFSTIFVSTAYTVKYLPEC